MFAGCHNMQEASAPRPAVVDQWLERAQESFDRMDMEDAQHAIDQALARDPNDPKLRLLGANIALSKLDYARTLELTADSNDAQLLALRGRAQWYSGDLQAAAATLEALLSDPSVHDPWAKAVSKLAGHGAGREPFRVQGSIVAVVEMPVVRGTALVVPVEIDGDQTLAIISTGTAEVVLDSAQRKEPSWISLRFAGRIEYQDVPAVSQDLSGISRQLNAPIKAMLGINFLRRANVTFDFEGRQFVLRQFAPPAPPQVTSLPVYYARGGGMMVQSSLSSDGLPASLWVDSSQLFPLALDTEGWKKAGVDPSKLAPLQGQPSVRHGEIPTLRLGSFGVSRVAAVLSNDIEPLEKSLGLNIDGVLGSGLLAALRVTLGDGGQTLWLEQTPIEEESPAQSVPTDPQQPSLGEGLQLQPTPSSTPQP